MNAEFNVFCSQSNEKWLFIMLVAGWQSHLLMTISIETKMSWEEMKKKKTGRWVKKNQIYSFGRWQRIKMRECAIKR